MKTRKVNQNVLSQFLKLEYMAYKLQQQKIDTYIYFQSFKPYLMDMNLFKSNTNVKQITY